MTVIGLASAGLIKSKIQEAYLQRQINIYLLQKEQLDRQARIDELAITQQKQKQTVLDKQQKLSQIQKLIKEKESLKTQKETTLEKQRQAVSSNNNLTQAEKTSIIAKLEKKNQTEILAIDGQLSELRVKEGEARVELQKESNIYAGQSLEIRNLEFQQAQSQNKLLSMQGGILGKIVGTLGMIRTIHAAITKYKERQVLLQKSENKEVKKGLLDKLKSAFFGAADSAASNPFWG